MLQSLVRPSKTILILDLRYKYNILRHIDLVLPARKLSWYIVTTILKASGRSSHVFEWLCHCVSIAVSNLGYFVEKKIRPSLCVGLSVPWMHGWMGDVCISDKPD